MAEAASSGQTVVEELLKQAHASVGPQGAQHGAAVAGAATTARPPSQGEIDQLLNQAEQALASINAPGAGEAPQGIKPFKLADFTSASSTTETATLDLIRDVELDLRIELGRTHMHLEDVLKLSKGSVVTLDKLAGDPADIF